MRERINSIVSSLGGHHKHIFIDKLQELLVGSQCVRFCAKGELSKVFRQLNQDPSRWVGLNQKQGQNKDSKQIRQLK